MNDGIIIHGEVAEPSMSLYSKKGHKVTVTEKSIANGYPLDEEKARHFLKVGQTYTVESIDVQGWSSTVLLQELPGIQFNSVHFIDKKQC